MEDFIYTYLRYLTSQSTRHVVVVNVNYTLMDIHYGPNAFQFPIIDNCYNYSPEYDIILMPIYYTGHFAHIIYDRSDRNNPLCIFVDSLPERDRLFDIGYVEFDLRRIDLIKRGICELTPGLLEEEIQIKTLPRSEFTEQTDGINCGFLFVYILKHICLIMVLCCFLI